MDTWGLLVPNLQVHIFRKAKVQNTWMFPRGRRLYPDFPLPASNPKEMVCLIDDGIIGAVDSCPTSHLGTWGGSLVHLRGQSSLVRYIEFLGSLQSLMHFPHGVNTELRTQAIGGLSSQRPYLRGEMEYWSISSRSKKKLNQEGRNIACCT